jgi:isopentenyl phosphate kinase
LETGVWKDFPERTKLFKQLTPQKDKKMSPSLGRSTGMDVTGGMQAKVNDMLALVDQIPGLEVVIFSGEEPGNIRRALQGATPGTLLHR